MQAVNEVGWGDGGYEKEREWRRLKMWGGVRIQ